MNDSPLLPPLSRAPLRVGLAGLGRFGCLHATVLAGLAEVEIAALCDSNADALCSQLALHKTAKGYSNFQEFINDPSLQAIVIVTPEQLHFEQALASMAKGLAVFLEKPMASSALEAAQLQQAARSADVLLQVGLVLRYEASHALLREEIARGNFGELVSIRVKRNCSRPWASKYLDRCPTVFETLIHDLDLMLWFSGSRAETVMAIERPALNYLHSEAVAALIRFSNGTHGIAESSWYIPANAPINVAAGDWRGTIDSELEVVGTLQTARLRLLDSPLNIWTDKYTEALDTCLWPLLHGQIRGALQAELSDFVSCVLQGKPSQVASLDDAVEGLRLGEAIVTAAATGKSVQLI